MGFLIRVLYGLFIGTFTKVDTFVLNDVRRWHGLALMVLKNIESPELNIIDLAYAYFLSFIYSLTTESITITIFLSSVAWVISAFVLLKIMNLFSMSYRNMLIVLILFTFMPSSLINTGSGLREAYQLLFVNLSIYCAVVIYLYRDIRYWFLLVVSLLLLSQLHITFVIFSLFLLSATLISTRLRSINLDKPFLFRLFLLSIPVYLLISISPLFSLLDMEKGVIASILTYQGGSAATVDRATYKMVIPDMDSLGNFFSLSMFIIKGFFQYLLEPMPWKMSSPVDLVLMVENILRVILIYLGLRSFHYVKDTKRTVLFLFISSYLILEFVWSVGTTNWGTAARHHVPALGIMLLMGFMFKDHIGQFKEPLK